MKYDLQERMINYAVEIIRIIDGLKGSYAGMHLGKQLLRSGTSTALNYAEAQCGESRRDFIHKLKISLKELRETYYCLSIIRKSDMHEYPGLIDGLKKETDELIAILTKSVQTANQNI